MANEIILSKETMSSIEVAELTGKKHAHVMRDIRTLLEQGVSESNFGLSSYKQTQPNGGFKEVSCYQLTKKGSLILASGYNAVLREKIIDRWEALETGKATPMYQVPQSFSEALMLAAKQQKLIEEQQKQLEANEKKIESLETRTRYLDIILSSKNATPVRIIAQDYGMKADEFNTMLKGYDIQYKQSGTWVLKKPYLSGGYVKSVPIPIQHKSGLSEIKNHTQWTQKGRLFLYEFLKGKDILPLIERADLFKEGGQYAI